MITIKKNARPLPWRKHPTPYSVLVSEIMLQQTQADRVTPKFLTFVKRFPSFRALARAPIADVLRLWSGLGYNRRALALKKCADVVIKKYQGKLPDILSQLEELPGVGPATARSILVYAFNRPEVFIETNVRAVFIHFFFPHKKNVTDHKLWPLVEKTLDQHNPRRWYNALMDYGTMLKKEFKNPAGRSAHHSRQSRFEGSNRQVRGLILRLLTRRSCSITQIAQKINRPSDTVLKNIAALSKEGFILIKGNVVRLKQ